MTSAKQEIRIREAFAHTELPDEPRSFEFTGPRAALAAHLIDKDSGQWHCVDYLIYDNGENLWCVWRR